ncbi:hypothetical protein LCGC14_1389580 [marine sediment metagenome]|uniref:Uncharacterized protein n=1 Tax=marine sediment metagenome TaxID=412755 RepID=A0A0F9K0D7_9ZZZZ
MKEAKLSQDDKKFIESLINKMNTLSEKEKETSRRYYEKYFLSKKDPPMITCK